MDSARPENVSERAKERQRREMGTLGSFEIVRRLAMRLRRSSE